MRILTNIVYIIENIKSFLFKTREKRVFKLLKENNLIISTAESCTGGLLSSRLTDISGSSKYIYQNFVTYANSAKIKLLDVKESSIEKYGVVSEEVALEMANGIKRKYDCDIAVSITGIAGPNGGTQTKPVGLVCMAIVNDKVEKSYIYKCNAKYYRRIMKYAFSNKLLEYIEEFIKANY